MSKAGERAADWLHIAILGRISSSDVVGGSDMMQDTSKEAAGCMLSVMDPTQRSASETTQAALGNTPRHSANGRLLVIGALLFW
jgi:hypothetical protein